MDGTGRNAGKRRTRGRGGEIRRAVESSEKFARNYGRPDSRDRSISPPARPRAPRIARISRTRNSPREDPGDRRARREEFRGIEASRKQPADNPYLPARRVALLSPFLRAVSRRDNAARTERVCHAIIEITLKVPRAGETRGRRSAPKERSAAVVPIANTVTITVCSAEYRRVDDPWRSRTLLDFGPRAVARGN